MNINTKVLTLLLVVFSAFYVESAFAYGADSENVVCKKPKFRKFTPANKTEVAPGSEISFHVTHVVEPGKIEVTAKKIPIEITVEDRNVFYIVRGKLPDSLQGTYARISIKAVALLGCKASGGWLLKITEAAAVPEAPKKPAEEITDEAAEGSAT